MKELTVHEAKTCLSALLVDVEQGGQFIITRRGIPVARLVSATPAAAHRSQACAQRQKVADTFTALDALQATTRLDMPFCEAIEQGRDCACLL
jgi:prevent-host-death family protein